MKKRCSKFKQVAILSLVVLFCIVSAPAVLAQHEGHKMPGMSKSKAKPKAAPKRKAKRKAKRRTAARGTKSGKPTVIPAAGGHTGHTPGMPMPTTAPATTASPDTHTPGMPMPASSPTAKPQASPAQHDMHTATPASSPQTNQP